jgi:hypothetical protein
MGQMTTFVSPVLRDAIKPVLGGKTVRHGSSVKRCVSRSIRRPN